MTDTKLYSHFNIKGHSDKQINHDLVYFSKCPSTTSTDSYIVEPGRHLSELLVNHAGRDKKSDIEEE